MAKRQGHQKTCNGVDHGAEDGGRLDELFQDVGLCCQGETIVQHLLKQLVHHNYIVLYRCFCADSKIVLEKKTTPRQMNQNIHLEEEQDVDPTWKVSTTLCRNSMTKSGGTSLCMTATK